MVDISTQITITTQLITYGIYNLILTADKKKTKNIEYKYIQYKSYYLSVLCPDVGTSLSNRDSYLWRQSVKLFINISGSSSMRMSNKMVTKQMDTSTFI